MYRTGRCPQSAEVRPWIVGGVVDDDDFRRGDVERGDALQAARQELGTPAGADDDRHLRRRGAVRLRAQRLTHLRADRDTGKALAELLRDCLADFRRRMHAGSVEPHLPNGTRSGQHDHERVAVRMFDDQVTDALLHAQVDELRRRCRPIAHRTRRPHVNSSDTAASNRSCTWGQVASSRPMSNGSVNSRVATGSTVKPSSNPAARAAAATRASTFPCG
jgi:hypothetical protein